MSDEAGDKTVRLDIWMWRARFFRTRSLSTDWILTSGVRLSRAGSTRRVIKPATMIMAGDIVTFGNAVHIRTVEVLAPGTRRGPAPEAAALYREISLET